MNKLNDEKKNKLKVDWIVNMEVHDNLILCYRSCNSDKKKKSNFEYYKELKIQKDQCDGLIVKSSFLVHQLWLSPT